MRLDRALAFFLAPLIALLLTLATAPAQAQRLIPPDPSWQEVDAPPPPAFKSEGLIALDMQGTTLTFGVLPESVTLSSDGVVRYVLVAKSDTGVVNGLYEGIRCTTGEFKTYARYNAGSGWVIAKDPSWRALQGVRHTLAVARTGACSGHAPNRSVADILRDLRHPAGRYEGLQ